MDIYYEETGHGFPMILLHGNQENHKIYEQLINDFKEEYRLIAIDSRYQGKSIKSGELSLNQMAEDVMHVADELQLEAYDVIGFSDGANIALTLANKDKRVKHMALLSPNSAPSGIKWPYLVSLWLFVIFIVPFCLYDKNARRKFKLTRFMLKEPHFTKDDLAAIKIPVLLMCGERDMIKLSDIHFIGESLPHCVTQVIPGATHFLLDDPYEKTKKEIGGFLYVCHQEQ